MHAIALTKVLTAASAVAVAAAQTPLAAGYLTLTASPVVLDTQRQLLITTVSDESAKTYIAIGTDDSGAPVKYSGNLPNAGTAAIPLNFKTVTSFYVGAATTGNVSVGTNTVGSTPWQIFSDTIATPSLGIDMQLTSGSGVATFEYTDNPFLIPIGVQAAVALGPDTRNPSALPHPDLQSLAGSKDGALTWVIHGWRLTINSGTGSWTCTARQAGLASP